MSTKERILETALRMFNQSSVHQVGVREIASTLGISPGNLSYHFPKKEDLIQALVTELGRKNDRSFDHFFAAPITLSSFLALLESMFRNQYAYRNLMFALVEITQHSADLNKDYKQTEHKRRALYRNVFQRLIERGTLQASAEDIEFLISFLSLLARFWIQEAAISYSNWTTEQTIQHYLKIVAMQLSLFATAEGKEMLQPWLQA